jgi:hypothetical protein
LPPAIALPLLMAAALGGCASPRAVLVNDNGEYITCAGTGIGIIGSIAAHGQFDTCMAEAKEKGYRVERQE